MLRSDDPIVDTSRKISTTGVVRGTTNIDVRRCGSASVSVIAITIRMSAIEPFEANHLRPSDVPLVTVEHGPRLKQGGI